MKSKAPLSLMEQLIMLVVFALSAALCLQIFVFSSQVSKHCKARDHAVTEVQNVAEIVKDSCGNKEKYAAVLNGSLYDNGFLINYDENWIPSSEDQAKYHITILPTNSDHPYLGTAEITAADQENDPLFSIVISWQKEVSHG